MGVKDLVFEALNNAEANGYDHIDRDPNAIVIDLQDQCQGLETVTAEELLPHILHWQTAMKRLKAAVDEFNKESMG